MVLTYFPTRALAAFALILGLGIAPAAQAKPPLRDVAEIDNALMAVAIADEIRKTCEGIDARMIRAFSTLQSLKSRAKALGYSDDEIDDYVTAKSEKRRMRSKAETYLQGQGVDAKKRDQLCAYGRREIARDSPVGRLLR